MNKKLVNVEMKGKVEVYMSHTMSLRIIRPHTLSGEADPCNVPVMKTGRDLLLLSTTLPSEQL